MPRFKNLGWQYSNDRLPPCMYPSEKSSDILCTAFRILPKVDKWMRFVSWLFIIPQPPGWQPHWFDQQFQIQKEPAKMQPTELLTSPCFLLSLIILHSLKLHMIDDIINQVHFYQTYLVAPWIHRWFSSDSPHHHNSSWSRCHWQQTARSRW